MVYRVAADLAAEWCPYSWPWFCAAGLEDFSTAMVDVEQLVVLSNWLVVLQVGNESLPPLLG